ATAHTTRTATRARPSASRFSPTSNALAGAILCRKSYKMVGRNMNAVARAIETRATADSEYFNSLSKSIRDDRRKNLEAIADWEERATTAHKAYHDRLRGPLTAAVHESSESRGRALKRTLSGAKPTDGADSLKKWKPASVNALAVAKKLLIDYDNVQRQVQHTTNGISKKSLGWNLQSDAAQAKRMVGVGYKKAQREIGEVIRGSMESEGGTTDDDDDREARAFFPGRGGDRAAASADCGINQTLDGAEKGVRWLTRSVPEAGTEFGSAAAGASG
ncbi:hypothetical protein IWX48DRAFT_169018, partial [Phyllosticta citricarpa]